jgi:hypothetical protein
MRSPSPEAKPRALFFRERLARGPTCLPLLAVLMAWLVAGTGCRSDEVPEDFSLRLGESGGFTGWSTEYLVQPNGDVTRFEDRLQGEITETSLGRLNPVDREELWELVRESQVLKSNPIELPDGNLTRFLTVTAAGRTARARWPAQGDPDEPSPVAGLYAACREILQRSE